MDDKVYCCAAMEYQLSLRCDMHPDPFDCGDRLIYYSAKTNKYGIIIHDGGSSFSVIQYCPWCGVKLPEAKREV